MTRQCYSKCSIATLSKRERSCVIRLLQLIEKKKIEVSFFYAVKRTCDTLMAIALECDGL